VCARALAHINFATWASRALRALRTARPRLTRVPAFKSEGGQTLIELALLLPIMLVFLLVMVDFGLALDHREVLQHAVREGARTAAVGKSESEIKQETVDQSQGVVDLAAVSVCYIDLDASGTANAGDNVRVSIDYTYHFTVGGGEITAGLGLTAPSIDMSPSAVARLETDSGVPPCPP
jgi:hypothetical protein